jgi:hypothetical protein
MYSNKNVGVLAWMILLFLLAIPVVNVIVVALLLIRGKTNQTIKNFFFAYFFFYLLAIFGMFNGTFDNISSIFG